MTTLNIKKAFYTCSCSVEYLTCDEVEDTCPICAKNNQVFPLTHIVEFIAERELI